MSIISIVKSLFEAQAGKEATAQADNNNNAWQFIGAGAGSALAGLLPLVAGSIAGNIQRNVRNGQANTDFQNRMRDYTVEPSQFQKGGQNEVRPIQAEKGEVAMLSDGQLVDVKAKKEHKDLKKGEPTDYLPDSYIFSNRTTFTKKKADNITVDEGMPMYSELDKEKNSEYEVTKLSDYMTKDKMTMAEIVKNIRNKIPLSTRKDDVFANKAIKLNKELRAKVLEPVMMINEAKKNNISVFKEGGYVKEYPLGGLTSLAGITEFLKNRASIPVQTIPGLNLGDLSVSSNRNPNTISNSFGSVLNLMGSTNSNTPQPPSYIDSLRQQVNRNLSGQMFNSALSGLGNLAALVGQDTRVDAPDYTTTKDTLNQLPDRVSQGTRDAVINQNRGQVNSLAKTALQSGIPFNRIQPYLAQATAQGIKASNDAMVNFDLKDLDLSSNKLRTLADVQMREATSIADRNNTQRQGTNNRLLALAGTGTNMLQSLNTGSAQRLGYNFEIDRLEREAKQQEINNKFTQLLMARLAKQLG